MDDGAPAGREIGDACFVVRAPSPTARALLVVATNTYNAYNNWGGSSVYAYHGRAGLQGFLHLQQTQGELF